MLVSSSSPAVSLGRAASRQRQRRLHPGGRRAPVVTTALLRVVDGGDAQSPSSRRVTWDQSADEVFVRVPVAEDVRGRDVDLEVHPTRLALRVRGQLVLEGPVEGAGAAEGAIDVDGCFFTLEDGGGGGSGDGDLSLGRHVLVTLAKRTPGYMSWPELLEDDRPDDTVTRRVWLDVAIRDGDEEGQEQQQQERRGRLVFGLYGNAAPRTVRNFVELCTGESREDGASDPANATSRDALHFLGTPFHRIIEGFMAQCGDTTFGDGTGGASIYGDSFEDEPGGLRLPHSSRGVLAMANAGPDTNSSQFYATFRATPHLDGKHVVFGRLEGGGEVLAALEAIGTPTGTPRGRAAVVACGAMANGASEEEAVAFAGEMPLQESEQGAAALSWVWEQPVMMVGEEEE